MKLEWTENESGEHIAKGLKLWYIVDHLNSMKDASIGISQNGEIFFAIHAPVFCDMNRAKEYCQDIEDTNA
jgi:hypothetical protein